MNAELDAEPIQKMCGAGSVLGPDFVENLTSLVGTRMRKPGEEAAAIEASFFSQYWC